MTWFKVDDGFYSSKKVLSIPRAQRLAAVGLWTMAGNWSGRELSDGVVPRYVLDEIGATPKLRQALITARLWLDRGEGTIEFHDWARYQPTRAEIEANREKERIRKEKYRASHGDKGGTDNGTPPGRGAESQQASGYPDPTRPDPTYIERVIEVGGRNTPPTPTTPFCSKHPEGTDTPCRGCQAARVAFDKPKATVPGIVTEPDCVSHPGRRARDCDRCAEEAVA